MDTIGGYPLSTPDVVILPINIALDGPNGGFQQVDTTYNEFLRQKVFDTLIQYQTPHQSKINHLYNKYK